MRNKLGLIWTLIFIYNFCSAQELQKEQLEEDLKYLQLGIEENQPSLNIYCKDWKKQSDSLIKSLHKQEYSPFEAFTKVSQLCALAKEGHYSVGQMTDSLHKGFSKNEYRYLPLSVIIHNQSIYISKDYSNEQCLKEGDEILSINNLSAAEIRHILHSCIPGDGDIKTYKDLRIEQSFNWRYYLNVDQSETFNIEYKRADEQVGRCELNALSLKEHISNFKEHYPSSQDDKPEIFYSLEYYNDTAYLKLPSFDRMRMERFDIKAKKFYKNLFKEFAEKETPVLVIDLRGNTGGRREMALEIVPFIIQSRDQAEYLSKSISWKGKERTYKMPRPSKYRFKGQIFVLVDGLTFSNGSVVARYLREFAGAKIIGSESGSRYQGFAAGSKQYLVLPNLGLRIGIPCYHLIYSDDGQNPDSKQSGAIPDIKVSASLQEKIDGESWSFFGTK